MRKTWLVLALAGLLVSGCGTENGEPIAPVTEVPTGDLSILLRSTESAPPIPTEGARATVSFGTERHELDLSTGSALLEGLRYGYWDIQLEVPGHYWHDSHRRVLVRPDTVVETVFDLGWPMCDPPGQSCY